MTQQSSPIEKQKNHYQYKMTGIWWIRYWNSDLDQVLRKENTKSGGQGMDLSMMNGYLQKTLTVIYGRIIGCIVINRLHCQKDLLELKLGGRKRQEKKH